MNTKSILMFIGGAIIGLASGIFGTKKYYQNKYLKQYEDDHTALEEYYKRTDEYSRSKDDDSKDEKNTTNYVITNSKPGGRMSQEERAEIKKKLDNNWRGTTDYAKMYKGDGYVNEKTLEMIKNTIDECSKSEELEPEDLTICANCYKYNPDEGICKEDGEEMSADDSCGEFERLEITSPEDEAFDEHQKNKGRPPKIISAQAYSELPPHIDQEVLYFYANDETLCDDNEEPIDDPERLLGDSLTKYDFVDSEEQIIFVMNYELDTCYEVQKINSSWSDTH